MRLFESDFFQGKIHVHNCLAIEPNAKSVKSDEPAMFHLKCFNLDCIIIEKRIICYLEELETNQKAIFKAISKHLLIKLHRALKTRPKSFNLF